jgi:hypothetical protein
MKGFAILLAIPAFLTAQDIQSRRPILALHVVVPFDVEYTSGMPVFVLYDDGLAIYRAKASSSHYPRFVSAKLEPGTVAKLRDLATGPGFRALDGAYDLVPQLTDQSLSTIRVWSTGYAKAVTVRGYAPDSPEPFANLFLMLAEFKAPGERAWLPDSLNVTLVGVDRPCAELAPVTWPSPLPLPTASMEAHVVRYRLPIHYLHHIQKLRKQYGNWDCTPIKISNTYWGLWYDYPFPGDSVWSSH